MRDLADPRWIHLKGVLFLLGGFLSAVLLIAEAPSWKLFLLLVLTIWCFCRFYYFAFYVVQHYVDPAYPFSGLLSFFRYLVSRRADRK